MNTSDSTIKHKTLVKRMPRQSIKTYVSKNIEDKNPKLIKTPCIFVTLKPSLKRNDHLQLLEVTTKQFTDKLAK
ncbi:hypothetical protein Hanom_Chr11g01064311 [Helianthus anomalus]